MDKLICCIRGKRSPGEGNGKPLQYACLENSMDRGAWSTTVHGVTKSLTQLSDYTFNPLSVGWRGREEVGDKGSGEQAFRLSEVSQTVSPPAIWTALLSWQPGSSGVAAEAAQPIWLLFVFPQAPPSTPNIILFFITYSLVSSALLLGLHSLSGHRLFHQPNNRCLGRKLIRSSERSWPLRAKENFLNKYVSAPPFLVSIEILPHFPVSLNKEGELMNTLGEHA